MCKENVIIIINSQLVTKNLILTQKQGKIWADGLMGDESRDCQTCKQTNKQKTPFKLSSECRKKKFFVTGYSGRWALKGNKYTKSVILNLLVLKIKTATNVVQEAQSEFA